MKPRSHPSGQSRGPSRGGKFSKFTSKRSVGRGPSKPAARSGFFTSSFSKEAAQAGGASKAFSKYSSERPVQASRPSSVPRPPRPAARPIHLPRPKPIDPAQISITYPARINKYLAYKKFATRRGADELIEANKVLLNGRIAVLGDKVNEGDTVEVRLDSKDKSQKRVYIAYHKPAGVLSGNAQEGEEDIMSTLTYNKIPVFPVGRLEKDSSGLIILTNDGRITDRLLNPVYAHEKEYEVRVDKTYSPSLLKILGDRLAHTQNIPASIEKIDQTSFKAILRDSGNATIVRACSELGFQVRQMNRTRIMNITVDGLKPGKWREITGKEQEEFLRALGL